MMARQTRMTNRLFGRFLRTKNDQKNRPFSATGWAPHQNVEESLEIIRTVFNDALHTWAIELKETGEPVCERRD